MEIKDFIALRYKPQIKDDSYLRSSSFCAFFEKLKDTDPYGTLRTTKNEKRGGKGGRKGGGKNRGKLGGGSPNGPSYGPNFGWVLAAVGCVVVVPILVPA
jgi:hypothetical protein